MHALTPRAQRTIWSSLGPSYESCCAEREEEGRRTDYETCILLEHGRIGSLPALSTSDEQVHGFIVAPPYIAIICYVDDH